jgi:hypothetical protein
MTYGSRRGGEGLTSRSKHRVFFFRTLEGCTRDLWHCSRSEGFCGNAISGPSVGDESGSVEHLLDIDPWVSGRRRKVWKRKPTDGAGGKLQTEANQRCKLMRTNDRRRGWAQLGSPSWVRRKLALKLQRRDWR